MDRLTQHAALAVLLSLTLAACGGGSSSANAGTTAPASSGSAAAATIQGVTTPGTVSVVSAKNAN